MQVKFVNTNDKPVTIRLIPSTSADVDIQTQTGAVTEQNKVVSIALSKGE